MHTVAFIKTQDGNITLILDAKNFSIGISHPNYQRILAALKSKEYDGLAELIDIPTAITNRMGGNKGSVTVRDGQVFFRGMATHNTVTDRILAFLNEGLPTEPLIRFLENLLENPMPAAVDELYDFLDHKGFPITEDGCFIGYKGITENWMDQHTRTINNTIGSIVSMGREKVDPDRRHECSYGLHVGTLEYATEFIGSGGRIVLVKVNPRDCIAVPKDHNCSKLRVCMYEVLSESAGLIESPMYPMPVNTPAYEEEEYDAEERWGDQDSDDDDDEETTVTVTTTTKTTKRQPCSYCGAKGGKKHAPKCKRPKKS